MLYYIITQAICREQTDALYTVFPILTASDIWAWTTRQEVFQNANYSVLHALRRTTCRDHTACKPHFFRLQLCGTVCYQKGWKSRLRRERYTFFTNFRSGTPARRQVTLENCVYSGQGGGMIYMEAGLKASITTTNKRTKGGGEFDMRNNMS